jgi:phospholipase C
MENRSFDEYFGTFPDAVGFYDPAGANIFSQANFLPNGLTPFRTSTFSANGEIAAGCNHGWLPQHQAFASGAMDGWATAQPGNPLTMGYFAANDIPYHWRLAQTFLLCDTYHCSVLGPTYPNRFFLMSGTVFNPIPSQAGSTVPYNGGTLLPQIDNGFNIGDPQPANPWQSGILSYPAIISQYNNTQPPGNQISWKIYDDQGWGPVGTANPGPPWLSWPPNPPPGAQTNPPAYLAYMSDPAKWPQVWQLNVLCFMNDQNGQGNGLGTGSTNPDPFYSATPGGAAQSNFEIDALAGNLPSVSWIVPPSYVSEHPKFSPMDGESYLARVVNAVVNGPDWENTVLIITYDENDGHFDHVVPPQADQTEPWVSGDPSGSAASPVGGGFRVPTIIVSPWTVNSATGVGLSSRAQPGKVFDHTSVIRYLEEVTGITCTNLPSLSSPNNFRRNTFSSLGLLINSSGTPVPASEINLPSFDVVDGWRNDALTRLFGTNPALNSSPSAVLAAPSTNQQWPAPQQQCYLIMDKTTFGQDEVDAMREVDNNGMLTGPATFPSAFYIVLDGFEFAELNLPGVIALPPGYEPLTPVPILIVEIAQTVPLGITVNVNPPVADNSGTATPTRFRFACDIVFPDDSAFQTVTPASPLVIDVSAAFTSRLTFNAPIQQIELVESADPFIENGQVTYLGPDLRVYEVQAGQGIFGATLPASTPPNDSTAAIAFIQQVLSNLNAPGSTYGAPFDTPPANPADPDISSITLYPQTGGTTGPAVYNFAVLRVSLQGISDTANNVRVFFRLMPALSTGTAFDPSTLYRRSYVQGDSSNPSNAAIDGVATNPNQESFDPGDPWPTRVPLLGVLNGDYVTFPFFATSRVTPNAQMTSQPPDWPNTQQIKPMAGGEVTHAYFGCWLDVNHKAGQFDASPSSGSPDGPFSSPKPICSFIRNAHQCLVAEISYDPIAIELGANPGDNDKLAQRNLFVAGGVA